MNESDEAPAAFLAASGETNADSDPAIAGEDAPPPSEADLGSTEAGQVATAEQQTGADAPTVFFLTVGWGRFPFERDAAPVQLQGSVALDVGAIRVLRRVALEPVGQEDTIRRDVTMPLRKLNIDSTIGCCMDGLAMKVVLHESINQTGTNTPREATLTLSVDGETPFTILLNPGVETIDQPMTMSNGLRAHVMGFQKKPIADCKEGYLLGRWAQRLISDDGRELGRFTGRYVAEDASRAGFIRGVFGEKQDGSHVFFGKVVGVDGRFKGLIKGTYADGRFTGTFHVNRNTISGAVEGRIAVAASSTNASIGVFRGRWSQQCGEAAGEQ